MACCRIVCYPESILSGKEEKKMTFGEKLSQLRKENNYTQEQLAELLQVSRQSISKWESNLAYPETDRLIKMGKLFSCSMDYLLNDEITDRTGTALPAAEQPAHTGGFPLFTVRTNLPEKKSEKMVFGMPLYHIGRNAHGFFALGLKARGVFSLGLFSRGIFSFGVLSLGLFSGGCFAIGGMAFGSFALGLWALGAVCMGLVATGALCVGCFSFGAVATARYLAVGDVARGMIALGQTEAVGSLYQCIGAVRETEVHIVDGLLSSHVPGIFSFIVRLIRPWIFG